MKIEIEIENVLFEKIIREAFKSVGARHNECWDTEPRGMMYHCLGRMKLPRQVASWQMYSPAGNRAVNTACKKAIANMDSPCALKHLRVTLQKVRSTPRAG